MALHVVVFPKLLRTAQLLTLMLNPITWVELVHPKPSDWVDQDVKNSCFFWCKVFFKAPFLIPWPGLALFMRFWVIYLLTANSLSLILGSPDIMGTLFNSMAMVFILDLCPTSFDLAKAFFRLSPLEEFTFQVDPDSTWTPEGELTHEAKKILLFPGLVQFILRHTKCRGEHSILRCHHGARRIDRLVSFMLLVAIYMRHLFVTLFAIHTNILPAARELCGRWRWVLGLSPQSWLFMLSELVENFVVFDLDTMTLDTIETRLQGQCNEDGDYHLMGWEDVKALAVVYPRVVGIFSIATFGLVILPTLVFALRTFSGSSDQVISKDEQQTKDIEILWGYVDHLHKENLELKKEMAHVKQKLHL